MIAQFYDCENFEPFARPRGADFVLGDHIQLITGDAATRDYLLNDFAQKPVCHAGILHGDYFLFYGGCLLATRQGALIATSPPQMADQYFEVSQPAIEYAVAEAVREWDSIGVLQPSGVAVLGQPWAENYFHFTLELIPRQRHFAGRPIVVSPVHMRHAFQLDLLQRTIGGGGFFAPGGSLRVRDPVLAWDTMSPEGIHWLRANAGISPQPGSRRIYARRSARGTRIGDGGGLAETPELLALLREFGFETVDFGNGEHSAAAQAAMLDGAGIVLAPHGAGMTNLVYLSPPLTVIEVITRQIPHACFMQMSSVLGFRHVALHSDAFDDHNDIVIPPDDLRKTLQMCRNS
jgi:hypothetical protein